MSIVYVDTSALMKRAVPELESGAVKEVLRRCHLDADVVVASSLAWLEVWRALRRLGYRDVSNGVRISMSGVDEIPFDGGVLRAARSVGPDNLRSLDSIHLASAVMVGADTIMTFDLRLAQAADAIGMAVFQPAQSNPDNSQS